MKSGLWSESAIFGEEVVLEATAVCQSGKRYLILQRFGPEMLPVQSLLQKAREEQLSHRESINLHEQTEVRLGNRLAKSEQERDDLMAVLDGLRLGTIMTDANGLVTFLSRKAQELVQTDPAKVLGCTLITGLAWKEEYTARIEEMGKLPASGRQPISVVVNRKKQPSVSLEVEVHDDPRESTKKILFLKDVTEVEELRRQLAGPTQFHTLIGKSPAMRSVHERIRDIAMVDASVLIQGETGTGKELVARALHELSSRTDKPFVAVNCGGLTESLLGSQLFGHKRGSFTGAMQDHEGFFEAADGGTLFLDEIGDMPLSIQTTLLRALQEGEIIRLGESRSRTVNVRVLAATNQDLQSLVDSGRFRSDLLYRIRVARLQLPPLRERREDIPLLSRAFFEKARVAIGKMGVQDISPTTMQMFLRYSWPGNVRELKGALDYALIHCRSSSIFPDDLPPELLELSHSAGPPVSPGTRNPRQEILQALEQANGRRAQAAKLLNMSRSTFYRRLRELEIPLENPSS
ncbi:MAG: sigma-54 interaction domain-containing protein [Nitrospirales bacterium]